MQDRLMAGFDEAIDAGIDVEIHRAEAAQCVIRPKAAQRNDVALKSRRGMGGFQNILRTARARNGNGHVASKSLHLDLLCKDLIVTKIVTEACQ